MRILTLLTVLLFSLSAFAHKASDGFIYLDQNNTDATTARIDLALRDLALVVALDRNNDQQVSGSEVTQARQAITNYIEAGVSFASASGQCRLQANQWGLTQHSDGPYAAAGYRLDCPQDEPVTALEYNLLFEVDSLHRGLVQRKTGDGEQLAVLGPDSRKADWSSASPSAVSSFIAFLQQGIVHLLFGYDHVLFLLVLMLPATLRKATKPDPQARSLLAQRLWQLAGIVTAFTVAHSITLALATLGILHPPIIFIEILIALSIAIAALNLIWPILGEKTWRLAFGFGLIHGFGFASVLADLTSGTAQTVIALAGFNIGVEAGQLGMLLVLFPLFYAVGHYRSYQRAAVPAMAVAVMVVSLYWAVERMGEL